MRFKVWGSFRGVISSVEYEASLTDISELLTGASSQRTKCVDAIALVFPFFKERKKRGYMPKLLTLCSYTRGPQVS